MKIGVIGDGLVGSVFKGLPDYEVVHRDGWKSLEWNALVNCAGVTSRILCEQEPHIEVLKGNVWLPLEIYDWAQTRQQPIPFIQFSSCAVYKHPSFPEELLDEYAPLLPIHVYNASKMLMEQCLAGSEAYIIRIPRVITDNGHHKDFGHHIKSWRFVEDRPVSIVRTETLRNTVGRILSGSVPPGIYNIATEVVRLPELAKQYGADAVSVPADSMAGLGPWPVLDTGKAERYGLL